MASDVGSISAAPTDLTGLSLFWDDHDIICHDEWMQKSPIRIPQR